MANGLAELAQFRTERNKTFDLDNGRHRLVCHAKPIHYRSGRGWDDIDLALDVQTDKFLASKNKVSVGFSRSGQVGKYIGLRYDNAHQFEVTLLDVMLDGQSWLPTTGDTFNAIEKGAGSQIIHTLPSGLRIIHHLNEVGVVSLLEVVRPVSDFEITEEIHLKGIICGNKQEDGTYQPDKRGRFNFLDAKTNEPLFWIHPPWFQDSDGTRHVSLEHSLQQIDGQLIYTKRPTRCGQDDLVLAQYPIFIDTNIYYSSTADGAIEYQGAADWDTAHDALTGTQLLSGNSNLLHIVATDRTTTKDTTYDIVRSWYYFDTSNLPDAATVTAAVLKIYGYPTGAGASATANVCAMQGTQADVLTAADYDAFSGSYYAINSTWSDSAYNSLTFNAQGRSDINLTGTTKICVREYDHDYLDAALTEDAAIWAGGYYAEQADTDKDPKLEIDYIYSPRHPAVIFQGPAIV